MNMRAIHHEERADVAGTGFTVLDRVYADGGFAGEAVGGSCGNVLVSLAMLHRRVAPVLALGMDDTGERLVSEFSQAGVNTRCIYRRMGLQSPVLAQQLDTLSGRHHFSFTCPETNADLPRYQPIGEVELASALPVLTCCSVFYADRLSESILEAMKAARSAGALVFFEPSSMHEDGLFEQALEIASILKYSADRLDGRLANVGCRGVKIVTHGAAGLEVIDEVSKVWCDPVIASAVTDTCGSGDMVSVGVIDWMLTNNFDTTTALTAGDLLMGVLTGQRLAAENCVYAGARGLFRERGAAYARQILDKHHATT